MLEGLPINQYREIEVTVGLNTVENKQVDKDAYWPEQPMPRESHMLPEHSQQLLRAARSGRIYKPPAPPEDDRENMEEEDEPKEVRKGFTVKKWVRVPRHLEDPEPEYLAKRRKGLPSQYAAINGGVALPTLMRETKVQKLDAEGNVSVYKVLVPEGQTIAGEVQEADAAVIEAAPVLAAPGTVVEGVGVVNAEGVVVANEILQQTPARRRPPIPKKKARRGPGRGKKKVVFVEGSTELVAPAAGGDPLAVARLKQETGSVEPSDDGDTPMHDAGDEEDGSDEEGSDEDHDEEMKDSPAPATISSFPAAPSSPLAIEPLIEVVKAEVQEAAPIQEAPSNTVVLDESTTPTDPPPLLAPSPEPLQPIETEAMPETKKRSSKDPSSSPDMPLSAISHSRQGSLNQIPTLPLDSSAFTADIPADVPADIPADISADIPADIPTDATSIEAISIEPIVSAEVVSIVTGSPAPSQSAPSPAPAPAPAVDLAPPAESEGEDDLLGSLERHLDKDESMGGS